MGYRGKVEEQERARELRAEGWTMPDIAEELGVSRSSVSLWTRDIQLPPHPRRRSPAARNGPNKLRAQKEAEIERLIIEGRDRIGRLRERELLVAGVALYAGEGSKTDGEVRFANSDSRMIAFFCAWLRHFFDIDESRLRVRIYLHEGHDLEAATRHWSTVTRIPVEQFRTPYRPVPKEGIRHSKHVFGCPSVSYSCSHTHRAIMGLVHALLDPYALVG